MVSLTDVLLAMSNIPVDDPIAEIWGRGLQGGYKINKYTGSLPITINANGDALLDYRIYGADGGVGEPTENLIDASLSQQTIEIKPSTQYAVSRYLDTPGQSASDLRFGVYDENDNLLWSDYLGTWWGENIKVYDNAKYFKITIPNRFLNAVSLVEGRRPDGIGTNKPYPENYIPYGYKLPMTVYKQEFMVTGDMLDQSNWILSRESPVYIGENQLGEGEYVSFSEQKIYRDVDGTLTPTDPPVPFPEIPTIAGATIIDYDGDPKPSQMYIKYKGKE